MKANIRSIATICFMISAIFCFLVFLNCSNPTSPKNETKKQEELFLSKITDAMDYTNPTTRQLALTLASNSPGEYNLGQICYIYDYLKENWKYVSDPFGFEYFAKASETINSNLSGDCDDFAILMAALISAIGGYIRISLATNANSGHAFTEVYLGKKADDVAETTLNYINQHYTNFFLQIFGINEVSSIWYRTDSNGGAWLNLDWWSKYPGGIYYEYTNCTIYYPTNGFYE